VYFWEDRPSEHPQSGFVPPRQGTLARIQNWTLSEGGHSGSAWRIGCRARPMGQD